MTPTPARYDLVSPEQYDIFEQSGVADLPIPVMMAFKPVTFERYAYPTHISSMREVLRYADHNCEAEVPGLYRAGATFPPVGYVNSFTIDEREMLDTLRNRVAAATLRDFGRSVKPATNLLVQMGPFRVMSHLARTFELAPMTLFEVGPGAAYLGAMMAVAGHRYLAFDVTQSLYIWQQYLLSTLAEGDFFETASRSDFDPAIASRIVHLPWWQYVKLLYGTMARADVVYSNSNLGEMSPLALKHVLHISREMLKDSPLGLFGYFSTGMTAQSSPEQIGAAFVSAGYRLVFKEPFMAYVLDGHDSRRLEEAFKDGIPFYEPRGKGKRFDANEVMSMKRSEAPLDAQLAAWNYGWQPPYID